MSDKERSNAFINTQNTDLLWKRYANMSTKYDFMKSFDDPPFNVNKRRLSFENTKKENSPEYDIQTIQQKPNKVGLEYYSPSSNRYTHEDFLEKISRKKPIGPHHNSVSSNSIFPNVTK